MSNALLKSIARLPATDFEEQLGNWIQQEIWANAHETRDSISL